MFNTVNGYFTPSSSQTKLKNNSQTKLKNNSQKKLKENLETYKKMEPSSVINSIGNISRFNDYKDEDGNTILHIAIENNWIPVVYMLLLRENASDFVNIQNKDGYTILIYAIIYDIRKKIPDIVDKILDIRNIDINLQNYHGDTALICASKNSDLDTIDKILDHPSVNVNVNLQNNSGGYTVLMYAIKKKLPNIAIKILKRPDVDINIKNNYGETALMFAIYYKLLDIAIKILERPDVDINIKNNKGQTAFDMARENGFIKLIIEKTLQKSSINNFFEYLFKNKLFNLLQTYLVASDLQFFINNITVIIINMANSKNNNIINNKDINKNTKKILNNMNKSMNGNMNKNNKNINDLLCYTIIKFLKTNYNLECVFYSSIKSITPIKGSALLTISELFKNINIHNTFYDRINVEYRNKNGRLQGINAGGLTKNFFFECQTEINELFSNFIPNIKSKNNNKIPYYTTLKTNIVSNWSDCIIVVYLLIFSKINNCPICLDESYFSIIAQTIYNLIVIDTNYTLKQKVFIINMLKLYDDINKKKIKYGIFKLLLTDRQKDNMENRVYALNNITPPLNFSTKKAKTNEIYSEKNVIETYISNISNKKEENRNKKNKNYMNTEMAKLKTNINSNPNKKKISELIKGAIELGIYKDPIDFYYTHFISEIVTFESFMKNLKFVNQGSDFKDEIIKLFNYMNEKDPKNILLLAQAITANTLLQKEYKINMFPGKTKILEFHTCFDSVDLYKDNFQIITENEVKNEEILNKFMDLVKTALKGNFVG